MGLWNIPLDVNSLIDYKGISFKQLCPTCMKKINLIKKCLTCNKELEYHELEWGYQLSKDNIIPIQKDMLKKIESKETVILSSYDTDSQMNRLEEIIQAKVYLLTPNENVVKPYFLLRDILIKNKKTLLVQYALKQKLHLGIIKVVQLTDRFGQVHSFLLLKEIVYVDRIKPIKPLPMETVTEEEIKLGLELFKLLEEKTEKPDYTALKDNRRELLEKILKGEVKVEGVKVEEKEKELVEQLKKSVETIKKKKKVVVDV